MTSTSRLDGPWHLLPVDSFRQGFYPLDDAQWVEQTLPAHWQQHPLFERYAGNMVYRTRFRLAELQGAQVADTTQPQAGERFWLRLNGTFYWSQPYFNGVDLGRHEGYFAPQEHDVSRWVDASGDNTLVVEVACPDEHDKFGKRLITGVFSHWDCIDPFTNPGGVWLPVELIRTGSTRVKQVQLDTMRIRDTEATVRYSATLDAAEAGLVRLRWTFTPKNFAGVVQTMESTATLAVGTNTLAGTLAVRDPQLWWTHDLGHPNCYTVTLEASYGAAVSDTYACTFGIRTFEMRKWIAYLNGVRVFIKGSNYAPGDTRIATMSREGYERDLQLARECHMNMLRVHAHVEHPLFYEAANLAGVLLWQDFPLQWLYRRSILPEALRQARLMIEQLRNHPAVAIWCMHNEPLYNADTSDERWITFIRTYISVFIWNWNRSVMDGQLKRAAEAIDSTRPVVRSSGEYAIPLVRKGTDTHFYFGWYSIYGKLRNLELVTRFVPKNIRFVTEFGAQSFPNLESTLRFVDADIAKIDWPRLVERHQFQADMLNHWINWRELPSLERLIEVSQTYQSTINRYYIDRLRFHKYHPTGGIVPFMFHDPNPAVLWSILDYWRVPKRSYAAMQLAFSPQYVFTLLDRDSYPRDQPVALPIYVVNDAHQAVSATLEAWLRGPDGAELAHIQRAVQLPADCRAMEAERLRLSPEHDGTYTLTLALRQENGPVMEQAYEFTVEMPAETKA